MGDKESRAAPDAQYSDRYSRIASVDEIRLRQVVSNLLTYAAVRVTEGAMSLSAKDDDRKSSRLIFKAPGRKHVINLKWILRCWGLSVRR
ncbi:MAG: hypothetical protein IPL71_20735 [Anaerolineales bacterium]|uniref:hypothetical protein n=1 Tax=Candidatus Villigracilis proximus TaxID=3140683 RepID=UPI003136AF58|nr:hypothetical protein [Anaerolineales bacterium]